MSVRARFYEHKGKDFVELKIVGDPNTIMTRATPAHVKDFPNEWRAYQEGKSEPEIEGTPLTEIPGVNDDMAMAYRLKGVRTAEEFAALSDAAVKSFGTGALTLRQAAQHMLDAQAFKAAQKQDAPKRRGRPPKKDVNHGDEREDFHRSEDEPVSGDDDRVAD